ncbi:MAG: type II toxin-antitoxin system VapC family toxin [Dermatophilaceae bacterium]
MIVIDASAMVEALIGRDADAELLDLLAGDIDAPHLLDVEVLSALRGLELGHQLKPAQAAQARLDHFAFTITRHDIEPLAERIWQLRHQLTTYDASYIVLAEAMSAPLYTCDAKLTAVRHAAAVQVIPRTH